MKITVPMDKFVTKEIEVEKILHFISPEGLNDLTCNGGDHEHTIGEKRPIAIVWAGGRGWRLCHDCSKHLMDGDKAEPDDIGKVLGDINQSMMNK